MMRQLLYEIKKLFGERLHIVLPALLLIACSVVCFLTIDGRKEFSGAEAERAVSEFYGRYSADPEGLEEFKTLRSEAVALKLAELAEKYGGALPDLKKHPELVYTYVFGSCIPDGVLLDEFETAKLRITAFDTGVSAVIDQALTNMERLKNESGAGLSDPLYQYQAYAYYKYAAVRDRAQVTAAPARGWDSLFSWRYGGIFLFAALVFFANGVFVPERHRGMLPMLRSMKRGRIDAGISKALLLIGGSGLLSLLFALVPFFIILLKQSYSDPNVSVQNIRSLALFPEVWTVKRFFVYDLLMKLLSGAAFGALLGLISLLTYETFSSLSIGFALFGALLICSRLPAARFPLVHALDPYSGCNIAAVSDRLYVLQPGLKCMSLLTAAPIAMVALLILASVACVLLFAGRRAGSAGSAGRLGKLISRIKIKPRDPERSAGRQKGRNLLSWELHKLLLSNTPVFLAVLLLLAAWTGRLVFRRAKSEPDREYRIYKTFLLSETEGAFSENGKLYSMLVTAYSSPEKGEELLRDALGRGEITEGQYGRFVRSLERIKEGSLSDDFGLASELYYEYSALADEGLDPHFTDTAGIEPLITGGASYPLYAALLITLLGAYLKERGGKDENEHFERILRGTKNGRAATFRAKLLAGIFITLALCAVFYGAEFLILTLGRTLPLSAPLCSLPRLAAVSGGMTFGGYLLLMYCLRIAAALLLCVFAVSVSALSANYPAAFGIALGVTLLPTLLYKAGLSGAGYASFGSFFGANEMLLFSAEKQLFSSSFGALAAFACAFAALALLLLLIALRKTSREGK
ncbi:MAG: hypothetical protein IK064_07210 [Clostridia bacterium]|nr:hypothetical protein [Clostridia bacterium]